MTMNKGGKFHFIYKVAVVIEPYIYVIESWWAKVGSSLFVVSWSDTLIQVVLERT